MDISVMPAELVEEIAVHLSVDDIMSCSMVNRQWRHAFNSNRIWKRFCTLHPEYFNKQIPKVNTMTEDFTEEYCSRKQFFQELKVEKNIIEGKIHVDKFDVGRVYCDNLLDLVDEVGNHWLIVSCVDSQDFVGHHKFVIWDMKDEPILHTSVSSPLNLIPRTFGTEMKLINKKIYYLSDPNVLVLEFSHPQYQLNFLGHIRRPYFSNCKQSQAPFACKSDTVLAFCYTDIHHRESLVPWVSVYNIDGSLRHKNYSTTELSEVRDKFNELIFSRSSVDFVTDFDSSSSGCNVFLVDCSFFYLRNAPQTLSVRLFSLKTFQFKTLLVKEVSKCICCRFDKEVFTLFYHVNNGEAKMEMLTCFNMKGDVIYETQLDSKNGDPYYEVVTAKKGKEVLVLKSTGEVTVVDVLQQKISNFVVPNLAQNFTGTVLNKNLMIIQHYKGKKLVTALWDYQQGFKLYSLDELLVHSRSHKIEPLKCFFFNQNCLSPPKVFAYECSCSSYAKNTISTIFVLSSF